MGKKIAIYGAGTIGACQATLTSGNGYSTVVIGHSEEGLSRCRNTMLQNWNDLIAQKSVSYTHLTLPTICSV